MGVPCMEISADSPRTLMQIVKLSLATVLGLLLFLATGSLGEPVPKLEFGSHRIKVKVGRRNSEKPTRLLFLARVKPLGNHYVL